MQTMENQPTKIFKGGVNIQDMKRRLQLCSNTDDIVCYNEAIDKCVASAEPGEFFARGACERAGKKFIRWLKEWRKDQNKKQAIKEKAEKEAAELKARMDTGFDLDACQQHGFNLAQCVGVNAVKRSLDGMDKEECKKREVKCELDAIRACELTTEPYRTWGECQNYYRYLNPPLKRDPDDRNYAEQCLGIIKDENGKWKKDPTKEPKKWNEVFPNGLKDNHGRCKGDIDKAMKRHWYYGKEAGEEYGDFRRDIHLCSINDYITDISENCQKSCCEAISDKRKAWDGQNPMTNSFFDQFNKKEPPSTGSNTCPSECSLTEPGCSKWLNPGKVYDSEDFKDKSHWVCEKDWDHYASDQYSLNEGLLERSKNLAGWARKGISRKPDEFPTDWLQIPTDCRSCDYGGDLKGAMEYLDDHFSDEDWEKAGTMKRHAEDRIRNFELGQDGKTMLMAKVNDKIRRMNTKKEQYERGLGQLEKNKELLLGFTSIDKDSQYQELLNFKSDVSVDLYMNNDHKEQFSAEFETHLGNLRAKLYDDAVAKLKVLFQANNMSENTQKMDEVEQLQLNVRNHPRIDTEDKNKFGKLAQELAQEQKEAHALAKLEQFDWHALEEGSDKNRQLMKWYDDFYDDFYHTSPKLKDQWHNKLAALREEFEVEKPLANKREEDKIKSCERNRDRCIFDGYEADEYGGKPVWMWTWDTPQCIKYDNQGNKTHMYLKSSVNTSPKLKLKLKEWYQSPPQPNNGNLLHPTKGHVQEFLDRCKPEWDPFVKTPDTIDIQEPTAADYLPDSSPGYLPDSSPDYLPDSSPGSSPGSSPDSAPDSHVMYEKNGSYSQFEGTNTDQTCDPKNYKYITISNRHSKEDCKAALKKILADDTDLEARMKKEWGEDYLAVAEEDLQDWPEGCYLYPDHAKVYFNKAIVSKKSYKNNRAKWIENGAQSICKKRVVPVAGSAPLYEKVGAYSQYDSERTDQSCDSDNYVYITEGNGHSKKDCEAAVASILGTELKNIQVTKEDFRFWPEGCYMNRAENKSYFNTHPHDTYDNQYAKDDWPEIGLESLCKRTQADEPGA